MLYPSSFVRANQIVTSSPKCVFLGYNDEHKEFLSFAPEARRTRIARIVNFIEHIPFYSLSSNFRLIDVSYLPHVLPTSSPSVSHPSITKFYERQPRQSPDVNFAVDPSPSLDHPPGNVSTEPLILRCSTRISKPPECHSIYACFTAQDHVSVPSSYSQAQKDPCW